MPKNRDTLSPGSRAEWRAWLRSNHEVSPGIWVLFRNTPFTVVSYEEALEEAICFGWIDSLISRVDDGRHMRLFTPRRRGSEWSEANRERAVDLMARGLMTEAGMEQVRLARESGLWYSKPAREFAMPEELEEALEASEKAALFFAELAPSYRRRYIAYVATAARPATRRSRAAKIAALMENGEKQALL